MYSIFEALMKENGYTAYKVSVETGIAQSTLSDWKKGKSVPKDDKMRKIADLFNVSVDYLRTGILTEKDNIIKEAILDAKISNDTELKEALEIYYKLNDRDKRIILNTIKMLGNM